jgi:hypothetical protein
VFIWKGSRQMLTRWNLSSVLRQVSPLSSIEMMTEVDRAGGRVEAVVPQPWLADFRIESGSLVLTDGVGRRRRIPLDAQPDGSPVVETFGNLALLTLPCDETEDATVKQPIPARVTRHLGHRGAIGAA